MPAATAPLRPQAQPPTARPAPRVEVLVLDQRLVMVLDRLVDAIDVRESYEPEVSGWDSRALIRQLERELAQRWSLGRPRERGQA
jgi:hypothetical protein